MKKKSKAGKYVAPTICAVLVALIALFYLSIGLWAMYIEPIAAPMLAIFILVPGVVLVGIIAALWQRYKEIEGGEEDDASQY